MKDMSIIDNFLDEREFRNYIYNLLPSLGFENILIDVPSVARQVPVTQHLCQA